MALLDLHACVYKEIFYAPCLPLIKKTPKERISEDTQIKEVLSYKERTSRSRHGFRPYTTIKAPIPSPTKVRIIHLSFGTLELWTRDFSNLTIKGYLAGTTPILLLRSSAFALCRFLSGARKDHVAYWQFFGIISWRRLWGIRVISHCFIPEIKGRTVQTRSMASVNQETGNPPTTIEWQLQTLSIVIE